MPTSFETVFKPRLSQVARAVTALVKMAQVDGEIRSFLPSEWSKGGSIKPDGFGMIAAPGSVCFDHQKCSRCGQPIRLSKWRVQIVFLHRGKRPVFLEFGERFCSGTCARNHAIQYVGQERYAGALAKPERTLILKEENRMQNWRLN